MDTPENNTSDSSDVPGGNDAAKSAAYGDKPTGADTPPNPEHAVYHCIVPLLDALGWRGDPGHLVIALPHMPEKMGIGEVLNTLANLRLEGVATEVNLANVDRRLLPCLFVPHKGTAKVLIASDDDGFLIYDGGSTEYTQMPRSPVKGTAVFFRQMEASENSLLHKQPDWMRKVMGRFRSVFFQVFLVSAILSLLALLSPVFIMTIYDKALGIGAERMLAFVGIGIFLYLTADMGFRFLRSNLSNFLSVRLGNITGNEILRRILYLPPSYTETANLGAQVARIRDFDTVREFFASPAAVALFEIPFLVILIGGLVIIGGPIAYVPIAAIALFVILGLAIMPSVSRASTEAARAGSEKHSFILETLANIRTIKIAGAARLWQERFQKLSADAAMANYLSSRNTAIINALSHFLVMSAGLTTMAVGVFLALDGQITLGALMASMILVWRILAPLRTGFGVLTQVGRIQRSITQIDRLMNMRLESKQEAHSAITAPPEGRIAFSNVSIRYVPEAPPALVGVNLSIDPGEVVVIVGHDGAGKSTILKLILGLYSPQIGQVLLDNKNVRQTDPVTLRHSIGYAPQSNLFFYGTISQNLRLVAPSASDEDLNDALWKAQAIDDVMSMEDGMETRIGDKSIDKLSVSLRRRLSMARVFLKKTKILLFDEPEIGLTDWEIDNFIATMQMIKGQETIIIVTHNERFFEFADKAIWLEKGRVRMAGTASEVSDVYLGQHQNVAAE